MLPHHKPAGVGYLHYPLDPSTHDPRPSTLDPRLSVFPGLTPVRALPVAGAYVFCGLADRRTVELQTGGLGLVFSMGASVFLQISGSAGGA